ncbi:GYF domain-containing protein [Rudaea sp.]|uniref:GYF domain-containing protein n=1 Tax=Rudaea sp. TaxID=2136325 RepID=UPI002ED57769
MATNWYYADSSNQQCGPVDSDWLATAFRSGKLVATTLVWREGLAGWLPIAQVAAELGLGNIATPPPLAAAARTAGKATIAKPSSSRSGLVIGLVVGFFVLIAFLGILAAIALPAYQDYTLRARVAAAMAELETDKLKVAEFRDSAHRCPVAGDDGFGEPGDYANRVVATLHMREKDGECIIEVTFASTGANAIGGKRLRATLDAQGQWRYDSDLPQRYLPLALRQSNLTSR